MKISHSAKEIYTECSYKYYLKYMLKLRPTGYKSPLAFGDAIDMGLNTLLETRDLGVAEDAFQQRWEFYSNKDVPYTKSDFDDWLLEEGIEGTQNQLTWHTLNARGMIMLKEFNDQIMPRIKEVIKVQIDQTVPNDLGDELVIKTDFIAVWEDGRRILFDNKTSSVAYEEDSVKHSPQLSIYFETLKQEYNLDAAGYIVIPKKLRKKKLPAIEIKVIIDTIPQATVDATLESYDETLTNIKAAKFQCNPEACMSKYGKCEYYAWCHGRDKTGLEEKK